VADRPVSEESLSDALEVDASETGAGLEELASRLRGGGPLELVRIAGGWQLATLPEHAPDLARFLQPQRHRLSRSMLEVLAIVAYRQPVTLGEIDAVRGVKSDYGLRQLVERRFVKDVGRRNTPGRPTLYGTTSQFLHAFGLPSLADLPELEWREIDAAEAAELPQSPDRGLGTSAPKPPEA